MNSNPEVMAERASTPMTPPQFVRDTQGKDRSERDAQPRKDNTIGAAPRVSEDPMRRTDRYRLVMPWSDRV